MFVKVARSAEVPEGGKPVVKIVGITPVALARVNGRVVVFEAFCPHSKWNLGASGMCFVGADGDVKVLCKGHGGLWSLSTGEGAVQGKPSNKLRVYAAVEVDGYIYVDLPVVASPTVL
ncbi:Ferredoxin subunits of nitrite reductase and ring-hydroxylating dioxygenase [Pyrobaculum oguniense TE7]|uniref:Ferredoxin subunits of nitrite reductase and ring-hydroxylating dioxygenase n=1 Tax=Pyrobaculum oguniense (strain DSM 13380 / JCM 10595 / TE7) TaxID=698757 RepID=H6Q9G4_PYROT|nr:Ferredoxin subunits of nitrite reductase and ring-hydroxylating dioxygenase [Pyrobaculum oguniense TE7]